MRPIDRGPCPMDDRGNPVFFSTYHDAKNDLLRRIGGYCSYCERKGYNLDIEHVVPKIHCPNLEREWTNFLLACRNCNSRKSDRNRSRYGYMWPDQDDTEAAFRYSSDGIVNTSAELSVGDRARAQALLELVGLNHIPRRNRRSLQQAKDLRWRQRKETWGKAEQVRQKLEEGNADVDVVIMIAEASGFWSVWMAVFHDVPQVRHRLRSAFSGTKS